MSEGKSNFFVSLEKMKVIRFMINSRYRILTESL